MIRFFALLTTLALAGSPALADIVINNGDAAGEGFNDPSSITPAGGNAATNLGQARLNAFRHAAMLVDATISSPVPVQVSAQMNNLGGTASSAVLGYASPASVFRDFPGATASATWYVSALADALHGSDLYPGADDITSVFNSDVDGDTVLGTYHWYYGFDEPGFSTVKFMPAVQHEIIHGLGFITFLDSSGQRYAGFNDAFMLYLEHHGATPADFPSMTDAQRAAAMIDDGNLHWVGPNVRTASGILTDGRFGDHVRMYAPNPYEDGSSTSHFDTTLTPDDLMEPFATSNPETILATALLHDIGWNISSSTASLPASDLLINAEITGNASPGSNTTSLQLGIINNSAYTVPHPTVEYVIPSNVSITSQTSSSGTCAILGSTLLRCDLVSLSPFTSGSVTLNASISDASETDLAFNLSSPLSDTHFENNNAIVVINPTASTPQLTVSDTDAVEGDTGDSAALLFKVTLSTVSNSDITVDYATSEISATSMSDYTHTEGTLVIPAGSLSAYIPVSIISDDAIEGDETLSLTLSNATGGVISQANATGTILNDDFLLLSVSNSSANEGNSGQNSTLTFAVTMNQTFSSDVTVDYRTFDGSASSASDYTAASGSLIIPAGQTRAEIAITVIGDDTYESNETMNIELINPSSPAVLSQAIATGTILNDDPAPTSTATSSGGGGGGMGLFLLCLLPLVLRRPPAAHDSTA
jgi:hypothetical protein